MSKALIVAIFGLIFVTSAQAATCDDLMQKMQLKLIALPLLAKSVTEIPGDIVIVTVPGMVYEDGDSLPDSAIVVHKEFTESYAILKNSIPNKVWIGVVEGVDGYADPALWNILFIEKDGVCVSETIPDRVYSVRGNAPNIFWSAIREWEGSHPGSKPDPHHCNKK